MKLRTVDVETNQHANYDEGDSEDEEDDEEVKGGGSRKRGAARR